MRLKTQISPDEVMWLKKYTTNAKYEKKYLTLLNELTAKVKKRKAEPIYVTQISGKGMSDSLFLISETIMKHCENKKLFCIN